MKKLFIAAIAVFGFATANAQYVAEKGDLQTSVDFRPFNNGNNDIFDNGAGINVGYFLSDKDALRVRFGLNTSSTKDSNSSLALDFKVGYERHFKSYDRVDLYGGAQFGMGFSNAKTYDAASQKMYKSASSTNIGVDVFTGINFYVYKKLYIGTELSFGFSSNKPNGTETPDGAGSIVKVDGGNATKTLKFAVTPALRLGWTF